MACFLPSYPHGSVWQMCSLPVLVAQLRFYKDEILGLWQLLCDKGQA